MLLSELAATLGLTLQGQDREFSGLNTLEAATENEVSFLANPKYAHFLTTTKAGAVIVSAEFASGVTSALISDHPYRDFARAAALFVHPQSSFSGISPLAVIHPDAKVGNGCTVHPHAHIGARAVVGAGTIIFPGVYVGEDVEIGMDCVLYPNAVVLAGTKIGNDCIIGSGAVLGTDGFGFVRIDGQMQKIPQIGTVTLADRVDIGANSCVDCATLGSTSIGKDSKLDNLVQIGHNVTLGEQCLIISQVGIAGSTKVGDRVTMAGQAGIAGHITIGNDATVGPQAGVAKSIPAGMTGGGSPFMDAKSFMRSTVLAPKLPELHRRVGQLEKELAELKELLKNRSE